MAPNKRSYVNFTDTKDFPFKIVNGQIEFPKLFSKTNKSDSIRFWNIYAILKNNKTTLNINMDIIDNEKFKEFNVIYKNLKIYIFTEYGIINGKLTKTEPTIIDIGKNLNKLNETNIITQSLINMRNLYLKKIKSGYVLNLDKINTINIFPMALQVYKKFKKYIKYPCYIQPKLDGIRLIGKNNLETNEVDLLSRRLNVFYGFDFIKEEIKILLQGYPDLILDGELYNHSMNLQKISGIVRNETDSIEKKELQYYIFDCIDLNKKYTFEKRFTILQELFKKNKFKYLVLTETINANSENDSDTLYNSYVKEKYEGIVYKNKDSLYEYSNIKEIRSYQFLKRKVNYDAEYKIVGYEQGTKGRDLGAIIFILETENGKTFKSVPNMTIKERKELYIEAKKNFETKFQNKMGTISFDEYSSDNIPLRSKFITIRDYE